MAKPTNRNEFKEFCLRRIGKGAIDINVTNDQVEDRIDEALQYYRDYHYSGSQRVYLKHQVTDTDKSNKYISITEDIFSVVRIFDLNETTLTSSDIFNVEYQYVLHNIHDISSFSLIPYFSMKQQLAEIQYLLIGKQPIRYNRHENKLYIDMNWDQVTTGNYIIIEAFTTIDPDTYSDVWNDRWLQKYTSALIKKNWAENLGKYKDVTLPGGIKFNASALFDQAKEEIQNLESEMLSAYSEMPRDIVG